MLQRDSARFSCRVLFKLMKTMKRCYSYCWSYCICSASRICSGSIIIPDIHQWSPLMPKILQGISLCRLYQHNSLRQFAGSISKENKSWSEKTLNVAQSKETFSKYRKNRTCCVSKTKSRFKSPQISHIQMKLNRAFGILSKLRYQASIHILKTEYHSLFRTHLIDACQSWGQNNKEAEKKFRTLENRALKK